MSKANMPDSSPAHLVVVPVPGSSAPLAATLIDGKPFVALKPMCDVLGIDVDSQRRKLKSKSWACTVMSTVQVGGQGREMYMVDRRTMTMWLATIDENRVAEQARPTVRALQAEAADALDAYFHKGAAINPRADEEQLQAVIGEAKMKLELCQVAKGLIHPDHLDAQARIILARGLGEAPELDPLRRPLYAQDFLKEKKVPSSQMTSVAGNFGKKVKAAYIAEHGREPEIHPQQMSNGKIREVKAYTEADRPLMEQVWQEYYAPLMLETGDAA